MKDLYICEKPDQAEKVAAEMGSAQKQAGFWRTARGDVTWAYGHMLELVEPEDYDASFQRPWRFSPLPCIPERFRYVPTQVRDWMDGKSRSFIENVKNPQLERIGALIRGADRVIIATDPDRQGEAIGRNILEHFGCRNEQRIGRLWLEGMDPASIRAALAQVKPGAETRRLFDVARGLAAADWLVGMNMTRAMTLKSVAKGVVSVGRVQSPTVALVVWRDRVIANFTPRDFYELSAKVRADGREIELRHAPKDDEKRLWDRARAEAVAGGMRGRKAVLAFEKTPKRTPPPRLYNLASLQKHAARKWKWPIAKTLKVAQALYEVHGATTYPRSNNEFLRESQAAQVPPITSHLVRMEMFRHLAGAQFTPRDSIYNDKKVAAHHAIIPTEANPPLAAMSGDERQLYELIAARFLQSLLPDYEYLSSRISTVSSGLEFAVTGAVPTKQGWRAVTGEEDSEGGAVLPEVPNGCVADVLTCLVQGKRTSPPDRYTEATLLEDMENIAKYVTDPEKQRLLKSKQGKVGSEDLGIGTSATRHEVMETIQAREYVVKQGKKDELVSTEKGQAFVALLEKELPALVDPAETAVWEMGLADVAEGVTTAESFIREVGDRVRGYIGVLAARPDVAKGGGGAGTGVVVQGVEVLRHDDPKSPFYTVPGVVKGRIFLEFWGHKLTAIEVARLVGGEVLTFEDLSGNYGAMEPGEVVFNAKKQPYPAMEFKNGFPKSQGAGGACGASKQGAVVQGMPSRPAGAGSKRGRLL